MSVSRTAIAATLLSLWACSAPEPPFPPMEQRLADYEVGAVTRQIIPGSQDDSLVIARTFDAVIDGETFLLADFGNDRVLRLDDDFDLLASLGRSGSGPGELKGPTRAMPWKETVIVSDWNNGRFAIYDKQGRHVRSIPAAGKPESFGVFADGRIIVPSPRHTHYAEIIATDGAPVPYAPRPIPLLPDSGDETLGSGGSIILTAAGDTTHVLDNEWGVLLKYAPGGELVIGRAIPADILERLRAFRTDLVRGLTRRGHRVVGAPLLKAMSFAEDGDIVITITHGATVALVVDPADYSVYRITTPLDHPDYDILRAATTTLVREGALFAFSSSGLASFPLLEPMR